MADDGAQRPEDVRFLSGLILVSEQPERLADFYRDVLGLPLAEERHGGTALHWECELGDVHFAIHPVADYEGEPTATGAVKLVFMTFDLARLVQWLQARGVPLCYPPTEFGTESRITAIRDQTKTSSSSPNSARSGLTTSRHIAPQAVISSKCGKAA